MMSAPAGNAVRPLLYSWAGGRNGAKAPGAGMWNAMKQSSPGTRWYYASAASEMAAPRPASEQVVTRLVHAKEAQPRLPPTKAELQRPSEYPGGFAARALDEQLRRRRESTAGASTSASLSFDGHADFQIDGMATPSQREAARVVSKQNQSTAGLLRNHAIRGKVLKIHGDKALLDAGSYGISEVPRSAITLENLQGEDAEAKAASRASMTDVRVGDVVQVLLSAVYTPYGDMQLDALKPDADQKKRAIWEELKLKMERRQAVIGRVLNDCPGGYAVGIAGFVALLPYSRAKAETVEDIGSSQTFEIVSMDDARKRIVVGDFRRKQ